MEIKILAVACVIVLTTALYKLLPFRRAEGKKPFLAFLPKYKKLVKHSLSRSQLDEKLSEYGFKKVKQESALGKFTRGSALGDISIKLTKVKVGLREISDNEHEITVQAGWVAAFDTGDYWQFITELSDKIENA